MFGEEGTHYAYSGINMPATPWTRELKQIQEKLQATTGALFNIALLNLYRDGNDKVGWHRDNENGMGSTPTIASVSFGETRDFQVREYATRSSKITFPLSHGSMVLMKGQMQNIWSHQVPKTAKKVGPRINITFRYVY
jgi:alkylated DNA repair dioxygenase AlkB